MSSRPERLSTVSEHSINLTPSSVVGERLRRSTDDDDQPFCIDDLFDFESSIDRAKEYDDEQNISKRKLSYESEDDFPSKVARSSSDDNTFNFAALTSTNMDACAEESSNCRNNTVTPPPLPSNGPIFVYKCDYCKQTTDDVTKMTEHLVNSKHLSASEYGARKSPDGRHQLVYVERMLALKNEQLKAGGTTAATSVIACPQCRSIFEDIFVCALHYKYAHDFATGFYAVCPVIHRERVALPPSPECARCGAHFDMRLLLHDHWRRNSDHNPGPAPSTNPQVFMLTTCSRCSRTYNDFLACAQHVDEHSSSSLDANGFTVEVRHVMVPLRKEELPMFNSRRDSNGIRDEVAALRRLLASSGEELNSKVQLIDGRIKHLQTMFGSHRR